MTPAGDARRHCARCSKHVHFLSAMSEAQAERLIADRRARGERICVRYESIDDEILFRPELAPAPVRALVMFAGLAAMMLSGCSEPELVAVDEQVCVYDGANGLRQVPRGEGECPAQIDGSAEEPPLWVELEPKPTIPDLEQPPQPELTPCDPPAERVNAAKKTRRDRWREKKGILLATQGDPLGGL